jgi:hypothetical protein
MSLSRSGWSRSVEVADPFVNVDVDGMVRLREIAANEQASLHVLQVVRAERIIENGREIIDPHPRQAQPLRIVEGSMDPPRMDDAPAVAEVVAVDPAHEKAALPIVLQNGDASSNRSTACPPSCVP